MLLTLPVIATFFTSAILLAYAPGPDIVFVMAQSAVHGPKAGLSTMLGLVTGLCFHTIIVAVGVAALILASPLAFTLLKVAGAAYLVYLAWLSWRAAAMQTSEEKPHFPGCWALYRRGIIMNITNPKVSIFFLAFLPQFCDPARGSVAAQCVLLGLLFMLAALIAFTSVSLLAGRVFSRFNSTARGQVILNRACAVIFVSLAVLLLTTHV